jgi:protein-S-isoprenylcysteine O-methyltransferase Ste14
MPQTGVIILIISLTFNTFAFREFKKSLTPHAPFSTPEVLLKEGVFTFSRNPVYLALVLSQFGLGFVFDTVWLLLTALILLMMLHYMVIPGEEKMLERTFKAKYLHYKQKTRRWI